MTLGSDAGQPRRPVPRQARGAEVSRRHLTPAIAQVTSNRSRFITLVHAANKSGADPIFMTDDYAAFALAGLAS